MTASLEAVSASLVDLNLAETNIEGDDTSTIQAYDVYGTDDYLSTLQLLKHGDFSDEKGIKALPRRRNKNQRFLAIQLRVALFPEMSETAAIINYERLVVPAKAFVAEKDKERAAADNYPKNVGKLLNIQGPWAGQEVDPMNLKGPTALPMPVEIGAASDFKPIFNFLAQNTAITEADEEGTLGLETTWKNPILEVERGIVYEDGRLDLCKKVVGPTHVGKLMESLEPNHQITQFLLGNNAISTTGAKRIAEFIHKYPSRMQTWYLAGCHITRHGLSILVPEMIASPTITNLWFKRNPFGPNSSSLLAELVLQTPKLRTLDLDRISTSPPVSECKWHWAKSLRQSLQIRCRPALRFGEPFLVHKSNRGCWNAPSSTGTRKEQTLKRLTLATTGLTSKGVSFLANALSETAHPLQTPNLAASLTTKAHGKKFNYLDDECIESLKPLVLSPQLRWLDLGRTVFTTDGFQDMRSTAANSELVYFNMHRVQIIDAKTNSSGEYESTAVPKSCSLEIRKQLAKNQAKYFPYIESYNRFLDSEDFRFLRNTSDVRKIDSMYRSRDKRLGLSMDVKWEKDYPLGN